MEVRHFFDPETFTLSYLVFDPVTRDAVVIDPVLNFDIGSGKVSTESAGVIISEIRESGLKLRLILETHAHADHLSGSQVFRSAFPEAKVAISQRIEQVQRVFKKKLLVEVLDNGKDFDYLFGDDETLTAGSLTIKAIPTPGHTPACSSFLMGDLLFTGDALFMPDYGTGRCDFPGGSASSLFHSIKRLYALPETTQVYVGHDYLPGNRGLKFLTTIGESKLGNIHLNERTSEGDFVSFREKRDKTLKAPRLLFPSLQVNVAAGKLPPKEASGESYIKIPISGTV